MKRILTITALLACGLMLSSCKTPEEKNAPKGSCRIWFKNLDLDFEAVHARLTDYTTGAVFAELRIPQGEEAYLGYVKQDEQDEKFSYIVELFRSNWIADSKVDPCAAKSGKKVTVNWAGSNIWNCE